MSGDPNLNNQFYIRNTENIPNNIFNSQLSQNDYNNYIDNRRDFDDRFQNIPNTTNINNSLSSRGDFETNSESSDEFNVEQNSYRQTNYQLKANTILEPKEPNYKANNIIYKNSTIIVNSLDRDLNFNNQSAFNFQVKFAPSDSTFTKKYPIYENSEFFLQTQRQKKLGVQGFYRNINLLKQRDDLLNNLYFGAFNEISAQLKSAGGYEIYNPSKPRGNLIGYNILYESGESGFAFIPNKFNNIKSIQLKKLILPNFIGTFPYDITLYGEILKNVPYLYVKIPELNENIYSTSSDIRESFIVMVREKGQNDNLLLNKFSYITFVPIIDNPYIYNPPTNNLNILTLQIILPPTFNYLLPALEYNGSRSGSQNVNYSSSSYDSNDFRKSILSDTQVVAQITMFNLKQEPSASIWTRKAKSTGVPQPSAFLNHSNIYDCPKGPKNLGNILCFAITTEDFFRPDVYPPGSSIKLINYATEINNIFYNPITDEIGGNRTLWKEFEHYIPNFFLQEYEGPNPIFPNSDPEAQNIKRQAKMVLKNQIARLLNQINDYLKSNCPIIDVGYIQDPPIYSEILPNLTNNNLKNFTFIEREKISNKTNRLRNCYELYNNYIKIKYFGLPNEKIPYCNVIGTNNKTSPCSCPDIIGTADENGIATKNTNFFAGMCQQLTASAFGDNDGPFRFTLESFYDSQRPQGCPVRGSQISSDQSSIYNQAICPNYNTFIRDNFKNAIIPTYNNTAILGTSAYFCNKEGLSNINFDSSSCNCKKCIDKSCSNSDELVFLQKYSFTNILNERSQNNINQVNTDEFLNLGINYTVEGLNIYLDLIKKNLIELKDLARDNQVFLNNIDGGSEFFSDQFELLTLNFNTFFTSIGEIISNNENLDNIPDIINDIRTYIILFNDTIFKPILFFDQNSIIQNSFQFLFSEENIIQQLIRNNIVQLSNLDLEEYKDIFYAWYTIVKSFEKFFEVVLLFYNYKINNINADIDLANLNKIINQVFTFFSNNLSLELNINTCLLTCTEINDFKVRCGNMCLDFGFSNIIQQNPVSNKFKINCITCRTKPIPTLPQNIPSVDEKSDQVEVLNKYPDYQNSYCNGTIKGNENNMCKPCCKYIRGANSFGLCNTIIIPVPSVLVSQLGRYYPLGSGIVSQKFFNDLLNKDKIWNDEDFKQFTGLNEGIIELPKLLGFDKNSNDGNIFFNGFINLLAINIIKNVLFNGGPLSFPTGVRDPGLDIKNKTKIVSLNSQNVFVFDIKSEIGNLNKII